MNIKQIATITSSIATGLILSGMPADAFSFSTNFSGTTFKGAVDPTRDVILNSIKVNDRTISDVVLVNSAQILQNDEYVGGNTGAASSDKADNASGEKLERATNESIVSSLGNRNLSNIIDVEDKGSFRINLFFEKAVSKLFFWELGMNSDLSVQALDANGGLIGNLFKITRNSWQSAGYSINTTEVGYAQQVGSWGLTSKDLDVTGSIFGLQVSADASHNGPDFKVVGESVAVPEPTTMAGLALAGAGFVAVRRRKQQATQQSY